MSEPDILNRLRDATDKAERTDGMRAAVPFLRMAIGEIERLRARQLPDGLEVMEYDGIFEIGYRSDVTETSWMWTSVATITPGFTERLSHGEDDYEYWADSASCM